MERSRNAVLVAALTSAKAERDRTAADAAAAREELRRQLVVQSAGVALPRLAASCRNGKCGVSTCTSAKNMDRYSYFH